jgi:hypothetical protein
LATIIHVSLQDYFNGDKNLIPIIPPRSSQRNFAWPGLQNKNMVAHTGFEPVISSLRGRDAKTNQLLALLASAGPALAFTSFPLKEEITKRAIAVNIPTTIQNTSQPVQLQENDRL